MNHAQVLTGRASWPIRNFMKLYEVSIGVNMFEQELENVSAVPRFVRVAWWCFSGSAASPVSSVQQQPKFAWSVWAASSMPWPDRCASTPNQINLTMIDNVMKWTAWQHRNPTKQNRKRTPSPTFCGASCSSSAMVDSPLSSFNSFTASSEACMPSAVATQTAA